MNRFLRCGVTAAAAISLLAFTADRANSGIYTWKDESGVLVFTDNPTLVPEGIEAKLWSAASSGKNVTVVLRTEEAAAPPSGIAPSNQAKEQQPEIPVPTVNQGAFAVQLARELGLGQNLFPEDAAQTLSDIRISPPLGTWALNSPMTPALTTRLRTLTVSAPQMGWISITPEQALLAFDTAAALTGLPIPSTAGAENGDASDPAISVPPLVYISPPPPRIAAYYTWVPVSAGFLWHGARVHGYYGLHGLHLNAHYFNGHHFVFKPHLVRRHLIKRLPGHHVVREDIHHRVQHLTAISPPSHPIRHRQNILHNHRIRQPHLKKRHHDEGSIHHQPHRKKHRAVHHRFSGPRHHTGRQHVTGKPHSVSKGHTDAKIHATSPRHHTGGGFHNGSAGTHHRPHGTHGSLP